MEHDNVKLIIDNQIFSFHQNIGSINQRMNKLVKLGILVAIISYYGFSPAVCTVSYKQVEI